MTSAHCNDRESGDGDARLVDVNDAIGNPEVQTGLETRHSARSVRAKSQRQLVDGVRYAFVAAAKRCRLRRTSQLQLAGA